MEKITSTAVHIASGYKSLPILPKNIAYMHVYNLKMHDCKILGISVTNENTEIYATNMQLHIIQFLVIRAPHLYVSPIIAI